MRTPHQWTQEILNTIPASMNWAQAYRLKEIIKRIQSEAVAEGRRRSTENILRLYPNLHKLKIQRASFCDPAPVPHDDPKHR